MKIILIFIAVYILSFKSQAQSAMDSVKQVVNNLFTAMKTSDPGLLRSTFADSAILQTIEKDKTGKVRIKTEVITEFADFLKSEEKGSMDEQIIFDVIKINADLASIWTPYKFFYKGKFSHCGVNSFQLVRINNVWKIQYLIDTRSRLGCL